MALPHATLAVPDATGTDTARDNSTNTTFISLPGELRNQIYENVLIKHGDDSPKIARTYPFITEPALLMTNKQIRKEALPIFYGQNEFKVAGKHALGSFPEEFDRERLSLLRAVHAFAPTDGPEILFRSKDPRIMPRIRQRFVSVVLDKYMHNYLRNRVYRLSEIMAESAEQYGVSRAVFLLPVFGTLFAGNPSSWVERWIFMDEYKQYLDELGEGSSKA